jgi:anti-sigma factor RsiW
MNCSQAENFVHAYVDGELLGEDRQSYERHLGTCNHCRVSSRFAGRFKAAVRAHLPRRPMPTAVEVRVGAALDALAATPGRRVWLTWPRMVPALAAVGVLVFVAGTLRHRRSFVLEQARRSHQAELPLDVVASDCGSITSWFRGRVDFPVHAPRLSEQVTCRGGRLVNVEDQPAAYLVYQDLGGHRVSVLVFDRQAAPIDAPHRRLVNGREVFYGSGPGVSTAAYHDRGLGYVITSDLDEESLTRLVSASFH